MPRVFLKGLVTVLLLGTALAACSRAEENRALLDAVERYNSVLRRTYMEANLDLMAGVATENQIRMLFPVIQAMRAEGSFMMAVQDTFSVKKVSMAGETGYVDTEETWTYWWQHKDTREITKPREILTYFVRYHLVRERDSWKVDRLEDIE
jgi:hypothetical protein